MRANVKVIRDTDTSMIWTVRFVEEGERYGRGSILIHGSEQPMVEFYDARYSHTDFGQFVSRYYVDTLLADFTPPVTRGLNLDGGVPEWSVSARCMKAIREWLAEQVKEAAHQPLVMDARAELSRLRSALEEIRGRWPWDTAAQPEEENYHDTESAYGNGIDVSTYEAACIARRALEGK